MNKLLTAIILSTLSSLSFAKTVKNYTYFEIQRNRITEKSFVENRQLVGAQLKYTWLELEPKKDEYHFDEIKKNLATLNSQGKKLWIQIQDVTLNIRFKNVPLYLQTEKEFNGGVAQHYTGEGKDAVPEGWIARRWDPAVRKRFQKLLLALGKEFDGKIEGINLPETAFAYGEREDLIPPGFTPELYKEATLETMGVLKKAFMKSIPVQYANYMPGEWRPENDKGYLKSIYDGATALKLGIGGPDVLPFKKGQMNHAYHFIPLVDGKTTVAMAVQEGNYAHVHPQTLKPINVQEIYNFAKDYLKTDYLFWCTEEPYYTRDVLPFLNSLTKKRVLI